MTDFKKKMPIDEIRESNMTYDLYAAMPDDGNRYYTPTKNLHPR